MKKYIFILTITAISNYAFAKTPHQETEEYCEKITDYYLAAALIRDKGVSEGYFLDHVDNSTTMTKEQKEGSKVGALVAYEKYPELSPEHIKSLTYQMCLDENAEDDEKESNQ